MRAPLFLLLVLGGLLCLDDAARAQADTRMEQIIHPSAEKAFDLIKEKRFGSSAFDSRSNKVVEMKSPFVPQKFNAKSYLTGSFHNEKSFWMGDFKFFTSTANNTSHPLFFAPGKTYQTKNVAVKEATGVKNYIDATATLPTRDFRGKERQKVDTLLTPEQAANNGYRGDLTELKSIDDIRALLNKNK